MSDKLDYLAHRKGMRDRSAALGKLIEAAREVRRIHAEKDAQAKALQTLAKAIEEKARLPRMPEWKVLDDGVAIHRLIDVLEEYEKV